MWPRGMQGWPDLGVPRWPAKSSSRGQRHPDLRSRAGSRKGLVGLRGEWEAAE